jgi:leucyl/phenylalanyl-tRNA---protein transferase
MLGDDIIDVTNGLTAETVERAYREGIFPMGYLRRRTVTWHRPNPRAILPLDGFHISRSLQRTLKSARFQVTYDREFASVMQACARRRSTWITPDFVRVYGELHAQGKAHSVEVWMEDRLVGGVYGAQLGGAFFAESKFHAVTDMSKVALASLVARLRERGFSLLEVQYLTPHLAQFGVVEIPLREYLRRLNAAVRLDCRFD